MKLMGVVDMVVVDGTVVDGVIMMLLVVCQDVGCLVSLTIDGLSLLMSRRT